MKDLRAEKCTRCGRSERNIDFVCARVVSVAKFNNRVDICRVADIFFVHKCHNSKYIACFIKQPCN